MHICDRRTFLKGSLATVPAMGLSACGLHPGEAEDDVSSIPTRQGLTLEDEQRFGPFGGNGQIPSSSPCGWPWLRNCVDRDGLHAPPFPSSPEQLLRGRLARVKIWSGNYIDGIELAWRDLETNRLIHSEHYGGFGGRAPDDQTALFLADDEVVNHIQVRFGKYVDQLLFGTNKGQIRTWGRDSGRTSFEEFHLEEGRGLHGLSGIHGKYIDAIMFWTFLLV